MANLSSRPFRISLLLRLMAAFLLVITLGAFVIYFLTTQATKNAFRLYTTQNSQLWAERLAPTFASYYAQTDSWQGVDVYMQMSLSTSQMTAMGGAGMMRSQSRGAQWGAMGGWMGGMDQRLIIADQHGVVIVDSAAFDEASAQTALSGSRLSLDEIASGAAITLDGRRVGTLIITPDDLHADSNPAGIFLATVQRSILISVLVAGLVGLLLVSLFFFQITAPIRQIQKAAGAIARGNLNQRVPVRTKDELGDLAATFNHMAGSLLNAELLRQKLLADVAHELRTPLAVIQANTEGIQDGVLALEMDQINTIHAETLLLGRLINDLRLISLAEAGELRLERRPEEIGRLLENARERFAAQCAQKAVELSLSVESGLPMIHVDVDRINQVMNNLISNALRYTPQGGTIKLRAERAAGDAKKIQVSVTDTGSGIALDDLPWVFDRFYRSDKSRARMSGGSGLGLAIVKQLVEAHGGTVAAHSPVYREAGRGCGTRILFSLPVLEGSIFPNKL